MKSSDQELIKYYPYYYDLAFNWLLHSKYSHLLNYEVAVPEEGTFYYEAVMLSREISSLNEYERPIFDKMVHIIKARKQKQYRLRKRYQSWKNQGYLVHFVTFTFSNDFINLKDSVKRKYFTRYMRDKCIDYFANVDFGEKNGRIHFHLCGVFKNSNEFTKSVVDKYGHQHYNNDWSYGFSDIQVSNSENTEYMDKLVNHAIKDSTESGSNIITMRHRKKLT